MSEILTFHFTGSKIDPTLVRAGELGALLASIEDALAASVIETHPTLTKDNLVIGLSSILPGSLELQFTTQLPEVVLPAYQNISRAIRENNPEEIPAGSRAPVDAILNFIKKTNTELTLSLVNGSVSTLATLTPEFKLPKATFITGETTLYGQLVRAGGVDPKAEIKTLSGKVLYCPFPVELAQQLGRYLYQTVGVSGIGKWDTSTYELVEFQIKELTSYEQSSLVEAFQELRQLAGPYYADIDDVTGYVSDLRKG